MASNIIVSLRCFKHIRVLRNLSNVSTAPDLKSYPTRLPYLSHSRHFFSVPHQTRRIKTAYSLQIELTKYCSAVLILAY